MGIILLLHLRCLIYSVIGFGSILLREICFKFIVFETVKHKCGITFGYLMCVSFQAPPLSTTNPQNCLMRTHLYQ